MLVNLQNEAELYGTLLKSINAKCPIIHPAFLYTHTYTHTPCTIHVSELLYSHDLY